MDVERSLETLETIILEEARKRGERFYRVILRPREETLFARERLSLESGRMEESFNVVRVSPCEDDVAEFPDRVVYYVTTGVSFERAASTAASVLNGAVDIAEIPYGGWNEEKGRWHKEGCCSRPRGLDARRMEIATLILSYKVLRFDMQRIAETVSGVGEGAESVGDRLESFERRVERLDPARIMFLSFLRDGRHYLIPRFMVSGYRWKDSLGAFRHEPEWLKPPGSESPCIAPETAGIENSGRFGILLQGDDRGAIGAERLLRYRELALGDIRIRGRLSRMCFDVAAEGEEWRLVLPGREPAD